MKKATQEFNNMLANYEKLAANILGNDKGVKPEDEPLKYEWAKQEGYDPHYDPNSDSVSWVPKPKAAYDVDNNLRLQGSMSPERVGEVYPAFGQKVQEIDPVLEKIYASALSGEITHQRAQELVLQLAATTYRDAWKDKGKGASKTAANFEQSIESMSNTKKLAGE